MKLTKDEIKNIFTSKSFKKQITKLKKNKKLDYELLDKLLPLLKKGNINNESILYFPEKYPISEGQFCALINQLGYLAENKEDVSEMFSEYQAYFEYKNIKFIWNIMFGQGISMTLISKFNKKIKFKEKLKIIL